MKSSFERVFTRVGVQVGLMAILALYFLTGCGKTEFSSKAELASSSKTSVSNVLIDPRLASKYPCGNGSEKKVLICHVPPGNADQKHEICIGLPAVAHHLDLHVAHADVAEHDQLGPCAKPESAVSEVSPE